MKEELFKHKLAYFILISFFSLTGFLFLASWPDIYYQRYLVVLMATFYFFWGIVTHVKSKKITKKITIEYLGVSVLAGLLLFLITI